jgi:hypothetical protein
MSLRALLWVAAGILGMQLWPLGRILDRLGWAAWEPFALGALIGALLSAAALLGRRAIPIRAWVGHGLFVLFAALAGFLISLPMATEFSLGNLTHPAVDAIVNQAIAKVLRVRGEIPEWPRAIELDGNLLRLRPHLAPKLRGLEATIRTLNARISAAGTIPSRDERANEYAILAWYLFNQVRERYGSEAAVSVCSEAVNSIADPELRAAFAASISGRR